MREVTVYYAFDDTEFYYRGECLAYEKEAFDCLKEINEKYSFFDKHMNIYAAPLESDEIEDWTDWLVNAADTCDFIHRDGDLTCLAEDFISREWGFCILNNDFNFETGWFKYNICSSEWEKVDE